MKYSPFKGLSASAPSRNVGKRPSASSKKLRLKPHRFMDTVVSGGGGPAVADTMGGELVSFRDEQGTEYIWGGDPEIWAGRNPNLFPVVGDGVQTVKHRMVQNDGIGVIQNMLPLIRHVSLLCRCRGRER